MIGATRFALLTLGLVGMITSVNAYCPNGCNAQGICGKNDKCTCYNRQDEGSTSDTDVPAFTGADCSLRTCPTGAAWVAVPTRDNFLVGADVTRPKTECSNAGYCDRVTGQCDCFPGYEGKACERTVCPNNCNNHGICLSLASIIAATPVAFRPAAYAAWDAEKHMGCYCDQGYRGPDCSLKECPSGDDVLLAYGATEGRDCGGRGKCNYETGTCECFPGYYGTSCSFQSTVH